MQTAIKFGEEMSDYSLSPDGTRLALITRKGDSPFSSDRKVNIVSYRTRFAQVREVSRTVADDPKKAGEKPISSINTSALTSS